MVALLCGLFFLALALFIWLVQWGVTQFFRMINEEFMHYRKTRK